MGDLDNLNPFDKDANALIRPSFDPGGNVTGAVNTIQDPFSGAKDAVSGAQRGIAGAGEGFKPPSVEEAKEAGEAREGERQLREEDRIRAGTRRSRTVLTGEEDEDDDSSISRRTLLGS